MAKTNWTRKLLDIPSTLQPLSTIDNSFLFTFHFFPFAIARYGMVFSFNHFNLFSVFSAHLYNVLSIQNDWTKMSNEKRLNELHKYKTKATKMAWKREHLNGQTINKIMKRRRIRLTVGWRYIKWNSPFHMPNGLKA